MIMLPAQTVLYIKVILVYSSEHKLATIRQGVVSIGAREGNLVVDRRTAGDVAVARLSLILRRC